MLDRNAGRTVAGLLALTGLVLIALPFRRGTLSHRLAIAGTVAIA